MATLTIRNLSEDTKTQLRKLATRNIKDFNDIPGLHLIDPWCPDTA